MQAKQSLFFTLMSLVGGFLGGAVFSLSTIQAQAQLNSQIGSTSNEPAYQDGTKVNVQNSIFVPVDGLKFVTQDLKTVAWLGFNGGNTVFALVDSNGEPSVSIGAGPGGKIAIHASGLGTTIEATSQASGSLVGLYSAPSKSGFYVTGSGSTAQFSLDAKGSVFTLPGLRGAPAFEFLGDQSGGKLTLFGDSRLPAVTIEGDGPGGLINVRDAKGMTTANVNGQGKFSSLADGKAVWSAPPAVKKN